MPQSASSDPKQLSLASLLSGAGAVAALGIGFLYIIGAVLIAGELRPTGIPLRDALPIIPLPQMLGRGMSVLLSSLAPALLIIFWGAFLVVFTRSMDRREIQIQAAWEEIGHEIDGISALLNDWTEQAAGLEPDEPTSVTNEELDQVKEKVSRLKGRTDALPKTEPHRRSWWSRFAVVALVVASLLVGAPASVLFLLVGQLLIASYLWIPRRWIGRAQAAIAGFALILFSFLVTAYYYPQQLPSVTLERADGPRITGNFIAQTGNDFFISVGRHMVVVPHAEVKSATVQGTKRRKSPFIASILWRWIKER
jgi:hypothetical protein